MNLKSIISDIAFAKGEFSDDKHKFWAKQPSDELVAKLEQFNGAELTISDEPFFLSVRKRGSQYLDKANKVIKTRAQNSIELVPDTTETVLGKDLDIKVS